VAAGGLKSLSDCFPSDPAVDARPRRFPIELAAPGPQAATEFAWFAVGNRPSTVRWLFHGQCRPTYHQGDVHGDLGAGCSSAL